MMMVMMELLAPDNLSPNCKVNAQNTVYSTPTSVLAHKLLSLVDMGSRVSKLFCHWSIFFLISSSPAQTILLVRDLLLVVLMSAVGAPPVGNKGDITHLGQETHH